MRRAVSDSYFLVAHFHYVLFGTVVFTMFGGFYFWWPKWTGKKLDETLGAWHFWSVFIGFNMTFLVMHWRGVMGSRTRRDAQARSAALQQLGLRLPDPGAAPGRTHQP